jgi:hypothetical protein
MRLPVIRLAVVQRRSNRGEATVLAEAIDLLDPAAAADLQGPPVEPASAGNGSAMSHNATNIKVLVQLDGGINVAVVAYC